MCVFSILSVTKNGQSETSSSKSPMVSCFFFLVLSSYPQESPRVEQAYSWIILKTSSKHFFFSQVSLEAVEKMMHELVDDGEVWWTECERGIRNMEHRCFYVLWSGLLVCWLLRLFSWWVVIPSLNFVFHVLSLFSMGSPAIVGCQPTFAHWWVSKIERCQKDFILKWLPPFLSSFIMQLGEVKLSWSIDQIRRISVENIASIVNQG